MPIRDGSATRRLTLVMCRGFVLGALGLALACSTDTSGLARRPAEGDAPGGAAGAPASNAGSAAGGAAGAGGAAAPPAELGEGSLSVVHGLVDGGSLFVCFRDVASGEALGGDVPEPAAGIAYGQAHRVLATWDLAQAAVEAALYAAVPSSVVGVSCSELERAAAAEEGRVSTGGADAGASDGGSAIPAFPSEPLVPRRAGSLSFPPGVLRPGADYVLVASGCSGPGASRGEESCGGPDVVLGSHQALILAELGAAPGEAAAGLGLQFLNASRAVARADLVLQGETPQQSLRLTTDVPFGAVRPRQAVPVAEPLGVELHVQGATLSDYTQPWSDALAASGEAELTTGSTYLLTYVGPLPAAAVDGLGRPRFVLVRAR